MVRINRFLAMCNLGSRRNVEQLIKSNRIMINNSPCNDLSRNIDPDTDKVYLDGKLLKSDTDLFYIMLNKPRNYLVTKKDDFGRKTVFKLLPEFPVNLFPVGRLDYLSEGLLLITNDGFLCNLILHPRFKLAKVYRVTIKGKLSDDNIRELRQGVLLDGRKTLPAIVHLKKSLDDIQVFRITIFEGRNRQIRRMFESFKVEVTNLKRLQIGDLKLANLPVGSWRFLSPLEVRKIIQNCLGKK
ncbi:MAG: rRNA pseudouridine synthase [Candidatus Cloacimonetes bacterium]|nr:rRNA pseudouridine synthase [Candidatus Cloacimonadota bacterium]